MDCEQYAKQPILAFNCFTHMQIGGMTCSSCTLGVEHSLLGHPGVIAVSVSLLQAEAKVEYYSNETSEVSLSYFGVYRLVNNCLPEIIESFVS